MGHVEQRHLSARDGALHRESPYLGGLLYLWKILSDRNHEFLLCIERKNAKAYASYS